MSFLSPDWLARAERICARVPLDPDSALRFGLELTDAPVSVTLLADPATGGFRFRATAGEATPPNPVFRLSRDEAATLVLGDPRARVDLFSTGTLELTGPFLLLFFLDRLLQLDTGGVLTALRGSALPASAAIPAPTPLDLSTMDVLPRTMAELEHELKATTPGGQLYVSRHGEQLVSTALGEARPGVPMRVDSLPIWYCCAKPLGAVAIGQLWERGLLDPADPVARHLPEFTGEGREGITLAQILTHTSALPMALDPLHGSMYAPDEIRADLVRRLRVPPESQPGARIAYAPWWGWWLLAEIVQRLDGRDYSRYLAEEVLAPCGIEQTRVVLDQAEYAELAETLPLIHISGGGLPTVPTHWYATESGCTRAIPGLNVRGPMSDLGRFFEVLLAGGRGPHGRILQPQTVAALTARHRVGLVDRFGNADWGLGFRVESRHLGPECTAYGSHASLATYGHYGLWTSTAFADPAHGVVVALHLNGKTFHDEHQERMIRLCDAIYADLGLAPASKESA